MATPPNSCDVINLDGVDCQKSLAWADRSCRSCVDDDDKGQRLLCNHEKPCQNCEASSKQCFYPPQRINPLTTCDGCRSSSAGCGGVPGSVCSTCDRRHIQCRWSEALACRECRKSCIVCEPDDRRCGIPCTQCRLRKKTCTEVQGGKKRPVTVEAGRPSESGTPSCEHRRRLASYADTFSGTSTVKRGGYDRQVTRAALPLWMRGNTGGGSAPDEGLIVQSHVETVLEISRNLPERSDDPSPALALDEAVLDGAPIPGSLTVEAVKRLLDSFNDRHNWFFESLYDGLVNEIVRSLHRVFRQQPLSAGDRTRAALGLAKGRLVLAASCPGDVQDYEAFLHKSRRQILPRWEKEAFGLLREDDFFNTPTLHGVHTLVTLLSTLFFENDFGFTGGSRETRALHGALEEAIYVLGLDKEPQGEATPDSDYKRRLFWMFIAINAHFASTGPDWSMVYNIGAAADLPRFPKSRFQGTASKLDLRSSTARFMASRLNNRCLALLTSDTTTIQDIISLDGRLLDFINSILPEQKLFWRHEIVFSAHAEPDEELRKAQLVAYISYKHIRGRLHRWSLKPPPSLKNELVDWPTHSAIEKECSQHLMALHSLQPSSAAFTCALVQGAVSLSIRIWQNPEESEAASIMSQLGAFINGLGGCSSPILQRGVQVINAVLILAMAKSQRMTQENATPQSIDADVSHCLSMIDAGVYDVMAAELQISEPPTAGTETDGPIEQRGLHANTLDNPQSRTNQGISYQLDHFYQDWSMCFDLR